MSTKAPPPFSPAIYGNFQILPKPTADPEAANMNASRDDQDPWIDILAVGIRFDLCYQCFLSLSKINKDRVAVNFCH